MTDTVTIKRDVRHVIEELDAAYNGSVEYNGMNADYANFAGMALGQFRSAMRDPDLTREKLELLLRKGIKKHRAKHHENGSWTRFVASYVAKSSNANRV